MKLQQILLLQVFFLLYASGNRVIEREDIIISRHKRAIGTKLTGIRGTCGGKYNETSGYIASPNYPSKNYPRYANCKYSVTVERGFVVKVSFLFMDMEKAPLQRLGDCQQDSLVLYDGKNESFPMLGQRYCGYETKFNPVFSTSNRIFLIFRSDSSRERQGFVLEYRTELPPKHAFNCDFESVNGLCSGWKQSKRDDYDWKFTNGPTPTGKRKVTGPWTDHTLKNEVGVYAYIEATSKPEGHTAQLISPPLDLSKAKTFCLTFWYHMNGTKVGSLKVDQKTVGGREKGKRRKRIFSRYGRQGPAWKLGRVNITGSNDSATFIFSAIRGKSFAGDIALDDIAIRKRSCPLLKPEKKKIISTVKPKTAKARTTTPPTLPPEATPGSKCPKGFYSCRTVNNCIERGWFCDGTKDCLENDDEENCDISGSVAPSTCYFSLWSGWSKCSVTCGGGSKKNEREAVNGEVGDPGCIGVSLMTEACNTEPCPAWSKWHSWESCSVSCGGGRQSRIRNCENEEIGKGSCIGPYVQFINCNGHNCPKWGEYGSWSNCPVTCGHGVVSRTRICMGGNIGDNGCIGNTTDIQTCKENNPSFRSCARPIVCPRRNRKLIKKKKRTCPKSCRSNAGCAVGKTCQCDGPCGKTCSNPDDTCSSIPTFDADGLRYNCSNQFFIGSKCVFYCTNGRRLIGAPNLNCQSNQMWDKSAFPTCSSKTPVKGTACPSKFFGSKKRGRRVTCTNGSQLGSTCTFICATGFRMLGRPRQRCQGNGKWDKAPIPQCRRIRRSRGGGGRGRSDGTTCPSRFLAKRQPGRRVTCTNGVQVGSTCTFICAAGFTMIGRPRQLCQSNRNWDKTPIPQCRRAQTGGGRTKPTATGGRACRKRRKKQDKCCGNVSYNSKLKICCDQSINEFKLGERCCGKTTYKPASEGCCDGTKYKTALDRCCGRTVYTPLEHLQCCGNSQVFNKLTHRCVPGFFGSQVVSLSPDAEEEEEEEEEE